MLDPVRLRLLCELSHRGTMTAVGEACGYTSSAVSQHLATLEREAGVRLYERAGRRVRLTAEGHRLVRHAQAVLDALEVAEADLRAAVVTAQTREVRRELKHPMFEWTARVNSAICSHGE